MNWNQYRVSVGGSDAPRVQVNRLSHSGNLLHPSGSSSNGRERCSHSRALPHAAAVALPFPNRLVIVWRIHHHLVGLIDPHEMHPPTMTTDGSMAVAHPTPLPSSRAEHGGAGRLVVHGVSGVNWNQYRVSVGGLCSPLVQV